MPQTIDPIDDGNVVPGHVTTCAGCGARGVYLHTDTGIVDKDGREIYVRLDGGLVALLAGKADGSCTDSLYCEDCATA